MLKTSILRRGGYAFIAVMSFVWLGSVKATEPTSSIININLPKDIKWVENEKAGSAQAIMVGDPAKPGLYIVLTKWHAHHMSRPHFHANDRFITVLEGTWWVGTGTKYDPDSTTALPKGSFVTHYGKGIHYDGAKDADVTLEILGMGPGTSVPAEVK